MDSPLSWLPRALATLTALCAFGVLAFGVCVAPAALARAAGPVRLWVWRALWMLCRACLAAAIVCAVWWLLMETAELADTQGPAATLAALPGIVRETLFGRLIAARLMVLAAALVLARPTPGRWRIAAVCGGLLPCLLAAHSHAWAMENGFSPLLLSDLVHLLSAGGWLGGLAALAVLVRGSPPDVGAAACREFSSWGKACVIGLFVSATIQAWSLVGGLPALLGTPYGLTAGVKTVLALVLLGLALLNRHRLAPALRGARPDQARRVLLASIGAQILAGVLAMLAAGLLSSLTPGIHAQPLWPFPLRPALVAFEDRDTAAELSWALAVLGLSLCLGVAAFPWRRFRAPLLAAAWVGVVCAAPRLDLLFVPAYPTSYYTAPVDASPDQGAPLYRQHCAGCHGETGRGDGPLAKALPVAPADLTAEHLWEHEDGELFWWLSHGIAAPDGRPAMPGFAGRLNEAELWSLIAFIRAKNARLSGRVETARPPPGRAHRHR